MSENAETAGKPQVALPDARGVRWGEGNVQINFLAKSRKLWVWVASIAAALVLVAVGLIVGTNKWVSNYRSTALNACEIGLRDYYFVDSGPTLDSVQDAQGHIDRAVLQRRLSSHIDDLNHSMDPLWSGVPWTLWADEQRAHIAWNKVIAWMQ